MRRLLHALLGRRRYHDRWARLAAAAEAAADAATATLDPRRGMAPALVPVRITRPGAARR